MRTLLLAACVAAISGCASREHLGPRYGVPNRDAYRAQVIHPDAAKDAKPIPGLDPQEASIISDGYYKSLAPPKSTQPRKQPMLIIEDPEQEKLPPPMGGPK